MDYFYNLRIHAQNITDWNLKSGQVTVDKCYLENLRIHAQNITDWNLKSGPVFGSPAAVDIFLSTNNNEL